MLKKTVGTFILASALVASVGAMESEAASPWNNSSLSQSSTQSGAWAKMINFKANKSVSPQAEALNGSGQSGTVSGTQIQNGLSGGEGAVSQTDDRTIDVGESENTRVEGSGTTTQEVAVKNPTYVFLGQRKSTAVFSFEASIEGGPSLQNQIVQDHTSQVSVDIEK